MGANPSKLAFAARSSAARRSGFFAEGQGGWDTKPLVTYSVPLRSRLVGRFLCGHPGRDLGA